jgi:hypothetical protein
LFQSAKSNLKKLGGQMLVMAVALLFDSFVSPGTLDAEAFRITGPGPPVTVHVKERIVVGGAVAVISPTRVPPAVRVTFVVRAGPGFVTVTLTFAMIPAKTAGGADMLTAMSGTTATRSNAATCPITVFHVSNPVEARYSPASQKVDVAVGVGSVAAPK